MHRNVARERLSTTSFSIPFFFSFLAFLSVCFFFMAFFMEDGGWD